MWGGGDTPRSFYKLPLFVLFRHFSVIWVLHQERIHVWSESAPPPPFWQINHANAAYFRLFWGYISHPPPLLDLPSFYISWIRPCSSLHLLHSKYFNPWWWGADTTNDTINEEESQKIIIHTNTSQDDSMFVQYGLGGSTPPWKEQKYGQPPRESSKNFNFPLQNVKINVL